MNENHNQLPASANTAKLLCRCLAAMTLIGQLAQAAPSGTGFTYQGRLFIGDVPANGLYDLQFTNYNLAAGGNALGGFNTNALTVANGLFTVTLDFGAVFDGTPRWLEISERTNSTGAFATLAPRQLLAAAPYATYATYAASAGTATSAASATYAASAGTAGTVAGLTILQNSSGAPNVIAGSPRNWVAGGVVGTTIGGGGATNYYGFAYNHNNWYDYFGLWYYDGGSTNSVSADFGTIGGGLDNTIETNATIATIGGGLENTIETNAIFATIGGGYYNTIETTAVYATIGGGNFNTIEANAYGATIGGGNNNTIEANAVYATIPGGNVNAATNFAFAAGNYAWAIHTGAFVWADSQDTPFTPFSSTANDQFAVRARGGVRFVTSGAGLTVDGPVSAANTIYADSAAQNTGALNPGLIFGGTGSSEGISSKRTSGTDQYGLDFYTQGSIRMIVNNNGNVGIGTTNNAYLLAVGSSTSPAYCNGTTWQNGSDRNGKENFVAINPRAVLEKVSALPITEWRYKVEADGTEHIGPMAQDFHAAFGLNGPDDKHIATVDEEGVALAAIQGLNQKLEETRAENADLRARLEKLERLIQSPK